ncbi:IS21 family transposase, partial [Brachybacterium sp. AOP35-5H-19]
PTGAPRVPRPRARTSAERDFLALGDGARAWLIEASAAGTVRIRAKMTAALELAALVGTDQVDAGLGIAATAGRFAEGDLATIVDHHLSGAAVADLVIADETHSAQPGTTSWAGFTTTTSMETTR